MTAPIYLVTGCSRGLGVEWVRQLLARGDSVLATCRNPDSATELQRVLEVHNASGKANFGLGLPLDIASDDSITSLVAAIEATGKVPAIDALVHNAGISAPTHPVDPVDKATKSALMDCFETNAVGPLLLTQALFPKLRAGTGKKIFFVSTIMASMENTFEKKGGSVSYRASKTALNMMGVCLACEHGPGTDDGFGITLCHPGWVQTDMGSAGNRSPPVAVPDSVKGMLAVLDKMGEHSKADFLDYTGAKLSW
eukprot:gnl/MRDRNA2_/MRDRNA2_70347_c0_seq1.p1 gnl/MRDRNA2_/MRDRNA2_70347_c0~~gnl/MRDRNA2_/MRDRNA2_70347_c0_seq1.p1  ORF type:complete len:253 (-),score=37.28 gnl/MRDRNA2_/MRDRNA2_70347_c0_seq1:151-909(-)